MIDESPQTVDIGGITEASLVGQNNGRKLLEILNEGIGDIVEDKKPHKIDGNMKDKKMAPSIEASLVEQNNGGELLDMEKLMELLNEGIGDNEEDKKPHEIDGNMKDKKTAPLIIKKYDCMVERRWCEIHKKTAKKYTDSKSCWTRNVKTGLYGYKMRKVSSWRCSEGVVLPFDSIT